MLKKKMLVFIVILIGAVILTRSPFSQQTDREKIMFIPKSQISSFWQITIEGFQTAIDEKGAYGVVMSTEVEEDYKGQAEIVRKAIAEEYDAIVISSISYEKMVDPVKEAINQGIEVVVIDSDVNVPDVEVRISTDNYSAGYKMGQKMAEMMGEEGNVGLLGFQVYTKNLEERIKGFEDAIKEQENMEIVEIEETLSTHEDAKRGTKSLIESDKNIGGIVAFNEIITVAMGEAISELKREDLVAIGFDNNTQVVDYLETDVLDGIAVQNQFAMGYLGATYAMDLLQGKKIKKGDIDTGVYIVTRDNIFEPDIQTILFPFEVEQ